MQVAPVGRRIVSSDDKQGVLHGGSRAAPDLSRMTEHLAELTLLLMARGMP